jgi:L-threonylcarbamoyladenylate synthase
MILEPNRKNLEACAAALRRGELVGMPTETVYGIAADALNPAAVRRIFALKGRPSENPLIVHLASPYDLDRVSVPTPQAEKLGVAFWPGPLTLVLPRRPEVPDEVTAGLDSVGVRVPAHPVARELLSLVGTPIAAPSANLFMGLSPTRAEDLSPRIRDGLFAILDGGPSEVGLESTVLDLTTDPPSLLRPGAVPRELLERLIGPLAKARARGHRSPGLYPRHYAPNRPLRLVDAIEREASGLTFGKACRPRQIQMPPDPATYGKVLYAALHTLDRQCPEEIQVESPPRTPEWEAVWDRLSRAATADS